MQYIIIIITLILSLIYLFTNKNEINEDFIPLENYPELNIIKDNYLIILEELNEIIKNKFWTNYDILHKKDIFRKNNLDYITSELKNSESKIEENTEEPKWKIFGLLFNKKAIEINKQLCPKTVALLESIPYISNAGFSCLEPNKSTDIHADNNTLFYRYQLPLIIPNGNTGFKVNNSTIKYKLNEPFIFDDCNTHQAWNYTDKIRIVLICDIDR